MNVTATPTPGSDFSLGMDISGLSERARQGDTGAIEKIAVGMESLFTSLLLKQMRQTLEPGSMFGADQGDILGGLFDQYMGDHLAQSRSLGIADLMERQLAPVNSSNEEWTA